MNSQEKDTFINFINSNNSFLSAINSLHPIKADIYLKVELLIINLKIRFSNQQNIIKNNHLLFHLFNGNFYIENDLIIINGQIYSYEYLCEIIESLNCKETNTTRMFVLPSSRNKIDLFRNQARVIDINSYFTSIDYTMKERAHFFERTCKLDNITIPYVTEMQNRFLDLLSHLTDNILKDDINIDEDIYYKILLALISLYPFVDYAKDKRNIPYESIKLPLNEIGLVKIKYQDSILDSIRSRINELNKKVSQILKETEAIISNCYISNRDVIDRLNERVIYLNSEIASSLIEYNEYSHTADVLNPIFFRYLYEAFISGNVIINEHFADPILKLFTIEKKEVKSYVAIHLGTLMKITDTVILSSETKKLALTPEPAF